MFCSYCGEKDDHHSQFCMKCGKPMQADADAPKKAKPLAIPPKRRRGLAISITVSAVLLAVVILVLVLSANPVAGRWYSQSGTELLLLKNGKGMTVTESETGRIHFMYAIGYKEAGYIEGEIYENENSPSSWFYVYDDRLEFNGEYFYRQRQKSTE